MSRENCKGYYRVPEFVVKQIFSDMEHMGKMLQELIDLHQEETKLKKHHKAYLHVREYTDVVCREHEKKLENIQDRWKEKKFCCGDMGCECSESDSELEADVIVENEVEETMASDDFTENMVMMSGKTLALMQEDLFVLAETIDVLILAMKAVMSGRVAPDAKVAQMLAIMETMTDFITSRWEEAEMSEIY